jgi:hypothetical protein
MMGADKRLRDVTKLGQATGLLSPPRDVPERGGNTTLGKVQ